MTQLRKLRREGRSYTLHTVIGRVMNLPAPFVWMVLAHAYLHPRPQ